MEEQITELEKQKGLLEPRLQFTSELTDMAEVRVGYLLSICNFIPGAKQNGTRPSAGYIRRERFSVLNCTDKTKEKQLVVILLV